MATTLELFVFHLRNKSFGFGKIIKVNNNFWVTCTFKRSNGSGKTRIASPIDSLICNSHGLLAGIILSLFIIRSVFPDISCIDTIPEFYIALQSSAVHTNTHTSVSSGITVSRRTLFYLHTESLIASL